jgi:hypothetical protein
MRHNLSGSEYTHREMHKHVAMPIADVGVRGIMLEKEDEEKNRADNGNDEEDDDEDEHDDRHDSCTDEEYNSHFDDEHNTDNDNDSQSKVMEGLRQAMKVKPSQSEIQPQRPEYGNSH